MELLEELSGNGSPEVILITGQASVETAIEALRRGAADYLTKPVDFARLKTVLEGLPAGTTAQQMVDTLVGDAADPHAPAIAAPPTAVNAPRRWRRVKCRFA